MWYLRPAQLLGHFNPIIFTSHLSELLLLPVYVLLNTNCALPLYEHLFQSKINILLHSTHFILRLMGPMTYTVRISQCRNANNSWHNLQANDRVHFDTILTEFRRYLLLSCKLCYTVITRMCCIRLCTYF